MKQRVIAKCKKYAATICTLALILTSFQSEMLDGIAAELFTSGSEQSLQTVTDGTASGSDSIGTTSGNDSVTSVSSGDIKLDYTKSLYYSEESTAKLTVTVSGGNSSTPVSGSFGVTVSVSGGDAKSYSSVSAGDSITLYTSETGDYIVNVEYLSHDMKIESEKFYYEVVKVPLDITWKDGVFRKVYDGSTEYKHILTEDSNVFDVTISNEADGREISVDTSAVAFAAGVSEICFEMDSANVGVKDATLKLESGVKAVDMFETSDNYVVKNVDDSTKVEVTTKSLSFTVTPKDKDYDATTIVEEIEVSGTVNNEEVSLMITNDDVEFDNIGNAEEDTDVGIKLKDSYVPELVVNDGNGNADNYSIEGTNINLVKAKIKANVFNVGNGEAYNGISYEHAYIDDNYIWVNAEGLSINANEGYLVSNDSKDSFVDSLSGLKPNEENIVTVYVKDEKGHISTVKIAGVKEDAEAPSIDYSIENTLIMTNETLNYKVNVEDGGSGVKELHYLVTTKEVENISDSDAWEVIVPVENIAEFDIKVPAYGTLYVKAVDNVGNTTELTSIQQVVLEKGAPEVTLEIDDSEVTDDNKVTNYATSHKLKISATDKEDTETKCSGISSIEWELYKLEDSDTKKPVLDGIKKAEKVPESLDDLVDNKIKTMELFAVIENIDSVSLNGEYELKVTVTDFCGNSSEQTATLYFDNSAPVIKHEIEETIVIQNCDWTYTIEIKDKYTKVSKVYYLVTTKAEGEVSDTDEWIFVEPNGESATFIVEVPAYGKLYVKAEDSLGNIAEAKYIRPVVLETSAPEIEINIDGNKVNDDGIVEGYKKSHLLEVIAKDDVNDTTEYSGVKSIEWELVGTNLNGCKEADNKPESLDNLSKYVKLDLSTNIENDSLNGEYKLTVTATDFCGNSSKKTIALYFDNTAPTISHSDINENLETSNKASEYNITIKDAHSGINNVWYLVTTETEADKINEWKAAEFDADNFNANFTVEVPAYGILYVKAVDNVGNISIDAIRPVVLEECEPNVEITVTDATSTSTITVENSESSESFDLRDWGYQKEYSFNVTATDLGQDSSNENYSGVASISWGLFKVDEDGKVAEVSSGSEENDEPETLEGLESVKGLTLEKTTVKDFDGEYELIIKVIDFCGNERTTSLKLYFDNTAPKGEMTIEEKSKEEGRDSEGKITQITNYHNTDYDVSVAVDELHLDEESVKLNVYLDGEDFGTYVLADGECSYAEDEKNKILTWNVKLLDRPGRPGITEGTYTFKLEGVDEAGNELVYMSPENIVVVDTTEPIITQISYENGEFTTADDGKDYVNDATTINFTVRDNNLTSKSNYTITENEGNKVIKDADIEWGNKDSNGDITGAITVTMYGNGVSQTVATTIVDKAGNEAVLDSEDLRRCLEHTSFENGVYTDTFTIDTVAPVITEIEYDTLAAFMENADDGRDYVNADTTIRFTVDEHNLTKQSDLSITEFSKELNPTNYDEAGNIYIAWSKENDTNTGSYVVGMRGEFGDEQTSTVRIVDRAGNEAVLDSENLRRCLEHTSFETGVYTDTFTVDTVVPVITEIEYDTLAAFIENADDGRDYVNADTTIRFTVDEHNLTKQSALSITEFSKTLNPTNYDEAGNIYIAWSKENDTNTGSYVVGMRGEFGDEQTSTVRIVDRAGNEAVLDSEDLRRCLEHTSFESGVYTDTFTVDTVAPVIIEIEYDTLAAFTENADDGRDYVNVDTTISFTVDEHNLTKQSALSITEFSQELNPTNYDEAGNIYIAWNKEDDTNTGSYVVGMRGEFGDEQTSTVRIVDRAGNEAVLDSEDLRRCLEHTSFESGVYTDTFTVDTVAPEIIEIRYDTADLFLDADDGLDYVKENTTISFVVNEHNLTYKSDLSVTEFSEDLNPENYDSETDKVYVLWSTESDTNTGSFTVGMRGEHGDSQTSTVTIVDRAGNVAEYNGALRSEDQTTFDKETGTYTDIFTVDTKVPVITGIAYDTIDAFVENADDGKDYVNADTTISFTVNEHNLTKKSELNITQFSESLNPEHFDENGKIFVPWSVNGDTNTGYYVVGMRDELGDGDEQTSKLVIVDRAGNPAVLESDELRRCKEHTSFTGGTYTDTFTVDTVIPEVTLKYSADPVVTVEEETGDVDYFANQVVVEIAVDEHNFNEDDKLSIEIDCTDGENSTYTYSDWIKKGDVNTIKYTLNGDSQYDFTINGKDRAGNIIKLVQNGIVNISVVQAAEEEEITLSTAVDKTNPLLGDGHAPVISVLGVFTPNSSGNDICGESHALYNTDITYRVRVYDPLSNNYASGIEKISFKVKGASGVERTVEIAKNGGVSAVDGMTVKLVSGDKSKLAKGVDNAYVYDITLHSGTFNTNDILLTVDAVDVSKNKLRTVASNMVSIDVTAPSITVTYDNNDVQNDMYFKADRTATIVITERNWNPSFMNIQIEGGELTGWTKNVSGTNGDGTTWTGQVIFTQEGPCSLSVSTVDCAGNQQAKETEYIGVAPNAFILDKTQPVISYVFDNEEVRNDKYYMAGRNLEITVTDEYFVGVNDIVVISDGQESGMTFSGMVATHSFDTDGIYSVYGTVTDQAGNVSEPFEISEFVVDLEVPTVEIEGIENLKAYGPNDEFKPNVSFPDTNFYEDGVTFTLIRENWTEQDEIITGNYDDLLYVLGMTSENVNNRNELYQLTDKSESIDGLYTLTINVVDLSGHTNNGEEGDTYQFSINRWGSVYVMDEATKAEIASYYLAKVPDIIISEYNLSDAEESWIDLITNGGERIRLEKDTDYSVITEADELECGWKKRTYTIFAKNFVTDGEYSVEIYVKDVKDNVSTNNDPSADGRGVSVSFIRDTEDPYVTLSGPEDGMTYEASTMSLIVNYGDNIRMRELIITITDERTGEIIDKKAYAVPIINEGGEKVLPDGADEELDIYSGQIVYTLNERTNAQVITVVAKDEAGNDTSKAGENADYTEHEIPTISATLTTSRFVLWYNNKTAFYGTIGGGLGGIALVMIIMLIAKRRKDKKKQEA